MRVNIKTLADACKLSPATVSRALRGLECVDPATRRHVETVAAELGYVRDPLLSNAFSLVRRKDKPVYRETLAFLTIAPPQNPEPRLWMSGVWQGITGRALELGYQVESFRLPDTVRSQRHLARQLSARGIRGLIILPSLAPFHHLDIDWPPSGAIEIGHALQDSKFPRIDRIFQDDIRMLLGHLRQRGYNRIGLALQARDEERRNWAVFSASLLFERQHKNTRILSFFEGKNQYNPEGLIRWIKKAKPEVIIANGPEPLDWLELAGVTVPEQIGVCRIDCVPGRPESGLMLNYKSFARTAVNHLCFSLEHGFGDDEGMPVTYSIPSLFFEGNTIRKK